MGSFSTDGSTRKGSSATGIGAVSDERDGWPNSGVGASHAQKSIGMDDDSW